MILSPTPSPSSVFVSIFITPILKMIKTNNLQSKTAVWYPKLSRLYLRYRPEYPNDGDGDGDADVHLSFCSPHLQFDHALDLHCPSLDLLPS